MTSARLASILAAIALAACSSGPAASAPPAPTHSGVSNPAPDALIVDPAAAGWNVAALQDVFDYVQSQKTTGFLIIDDGRIVAERNWPLPAEAATFKTNFVHGVSRDGALLEDVASAQKSFIAIMAGVAIDRGLLDVSKTVTSYIGPGWSKASREQEAAITVRNLMEMSSGLKENLTYDAPAGSKFLYNTAAYAIMKPVLEKASKRTLDDITAAWLTRPAGMTETGWRKRPGAFADVGNPTGLVTTPRDLAKLGAIILDGGKASDGTRIVSASSLKFLLSRSANNPAYGHLWWLNGSDYTLKPAGRRVDSQLIPAAPADLVAALGAQDRKLYVVPSRKLLVVRVGQAAETDFDQQIWLRLMKALPPK